MRYISTRGAAPELDFTGTLLTGLAEDGGLYLPKSWPQISTTAMSRLGGRPYAEIASVILRPFLGRRLLAGDSLSDLVGAAYAGFRHSSVAPLVEIGPNLFLMELFHGPTLAFKDMALQVLGRLYDHVLAEAGRRITIIGATSGDTGSAALEACRDRRAIDIFILYPKGRVSEVQRRQMTTINAGNVFTLAIDGSFDDCQDLVKAMFADRAFRERIGMSAVNSINWARIAIQIAYYFAAALSLGAPQRRIGFAVPSGNFGNVYAGYAASRMGLPVEKLIVGSNRNDILTRFFATGELALGQVRPSLSPSMDIQISSNLERLLFDLYDRRGAKLAAAMAAFRRRGRLRPPEAAFARAARLFSAHRLDDRGTLAAMRDLYRRTGEILDPHSAIGIAAALAKRGDPRLPIVALATAHPAKFPEAVERATGKRPMLPDHLADLLTRRERSADLPKDIERIKAFVLARSRAARD